MTDLNAPVPELVTVSDLHEFDRNPRRGDVDAIAASLDRFGFLSTPVFRTETRKGKKVKVVYAGNHRVRAAKARGIEQIHAIRADHLSSEEVQDFALTDNRTSDIAEYDAEQFADLVANTQQHDAELLEALDLDEQQLAELFRAVDPEPSSNLDDFSMMEGVIDSEVGVKTIVLAFGDHRYAELIRTFQGVPGETNSEKVLTLADHWLKTQ